MSENTNQYKSEKRVIYEWESLKDEWTKFVFVSRRLMMIQFHYLTCTDPRRLGCHSGAGNAKAAKTLVAWLACLPIISPKINCRDPSSKTFSKTWSWDVETGSSPWWMDDHLASKLYLVKLVQLMHRASEKRDRLSMC